MSERRLKTIIAGALVLASFVLIGLGHDSYIAGLGAMAGGYLFGQATR